MVLVISLFVFVCVCVGMCVCHCYSLQWHTSKDSWSLRRKEHTEYSARIERFARKLFDSKDTIVQSKKKNTLILHIAIFPQSHLSIIIHVLDSNMRSLPKRSNSTDMQACIHVSRRF